MAAGGVVVLVGGAGGDDGAGAAPGVGVDIFPDPSIQYKIYQQNSALFKKCRSPPPTLRNLSRRKFFDRCTVLITQNKN